MDSNSVDGNGVDSNGVDSHSADSHSTDSMENCSAVVLMAEATWRRIREQNMLDATVSHA